MYSTYFYCWCDVRNYAFLEPVVHTTGCPRNRLLLSRSPMLERNLAIIGLSVCLSVCYLSHVGIGLKLLNVESCGFHHSYYTGCMSDVLWTSNWQHWCSSRYTVAHLSDACKSAREASHHLRSCDAITCVIPWSRTHLGDRLFDVAGPRLWNKLPAPLRSSDSLCQFKRQLKTFLFKD